MYSKKIGAGIVSLAMLASSFATAVPAFTASAAGVDKSTYSDLLNASVKFYDANLCGNDVSGNNFSWRKNCHTFDSQIPLDKTNINGNSSVVSVVDSDGNGKVDVEGGYHDAGDHVKFGLPAAYSASTLGWSYSEFKSAFTATGASSQMLKTLNNFNDYFVKSTYLDGSGNVVAFCYQVGDGKADHIYWGSPEAQKDTTTNEGYSAYNRNTYFATSSNPATDIVSNTAASLAASYVNTSNAEHLKYAKALYSFAKNNSKQTAKEGASEFYNSGSYLDDMAWAAVWLYKATNDSSYLADANSYISEAGYAATSPNWTHCWNNVWNGVLVMMAELDTANSSTYWGYVSKELDHFKNDLKKTGVYSVQDDWGSARYNATAQMIACIYDRANNSSTYSSWAETQMDYLLGNNSNNLCYVAGFNSKSVKQPHHRAAQGQSTAEASGYSHELTGALVGGPKSDGSYHDRTVEYEYTEVALDYNAGLVGAAAGLYSISSGLKEDPTTTTTTSTTTTTPRNTNTSTSTSTTTTPATSSTLKQTVSVNSTIKASEWSDKNNHFVIKMADLGIQKGDVITKVTYELSSSTKLGDCTFAYAMGVTNDCPAKTDDWWYQGDSFNKTFTGNSATLTWNVPSNIGSYANPDSDIHLGAYYFNPDAQGNRSGSITLKSVTVEFTRAGSSSGTTTTTTTPRVTTTTTPRVTTTTTPKNTSTTTSPSGNKQKQTVTVNDTIKASEWSDKNNHFVVKMADFGIQKGDVITKVTYELSSSTKLGDCTFAYAMGVTNDCPAKTDDWWYQGDSFNKTFTGNSATLTWNVPSNIGSYANPDGDIHLGAYYFNPDAQGNRSGSVTLKSVTVEFTRAGSSSGTTTTTTTTPRQTSTTTTTTKTPSTSGGKTASVTVNETLNAKDWSDENNLFSVKTADFGIQRGDIIRSVTFEISSSTKLGNCTFAYGMGVTNDCTAKTDDWWYQGEGIDFVFSGSTATLVWNVDEKIGAYVNPDGEIHLGAYYFNPDAQGNRSGSITLKNVKVTFDRPSESTTTTTTTPRQTSATTTTTPKQTTVTTTTTPKQTSTTTTTTTKGGSSTGKKGDINGDGKVNITDLFTLAQHIATVKTITGDALKNADVNGDNKVNIADLFKIAQVIVGLASL